jgi:hypothetical protein
LLGRFFLALETKGIVSNYLDPLQIVVLVYYHDQRWTSTIYLFIPLGYIARIQVQDDPKLLGDSVDVPISKGSGRRFDSRCEIFSLLDGKKLAGVGKKPRGLVF